MKTFAWLVLVSGSILLGSVPAHAEGPARGGWPTYRTGRSPAPAGRSLSNNPHVAANQTAQRVSLASGMDKAGHLWEGRLHQWKLFGLVGLNGRQR